MTLPGNIRDRELKKFVEDSNGDTAVRTLSEILGSVTGSFSPSGLKTAIKITNLTANTAAAALPLTPLTDRNSIIILNRSTTDSLFIGNSDVTSSGALEGWEVEAGSFFTVDITDAIVIYGISTATINLKIMELA